MRRWIGLITLSVWAWGCGIKAPPRPPKAVAPTATQTSTAAHTTTATQASEAVR